MYYVYKTTNRLNGKFYIGVHKSDDIGRDKYMGSGIALKKAIEKYGEVNFEREILFETKHKEKAYELEFKLVEIDEHTYNLNTGGNGSWDYVNSLELENPMKNNKVVEKVITASKITREKKPEKYADISRSNLQKAIKANLGKKHSNDTIEKRSNSLKQFYEKNESPLKNRNLSNDHKEKIKQSWSEERKAEKSEWFKRRIDDNPDIVKTNLGKTFSKETKEKMSNSMGEAWKKRKLTQCPHCGKISKNAGNMRRWHFNNCKEKNS